MSFQTFLQKTYVNVAKEAKCRPSDVEEVYESLWIFLKRALGQPNFPQVYLANLGTFYVSASDLRRRIIMMIRKYRKGIVNETTLGFFMSNFWPKYKQVHKTELILKKKKQWKKEDSKKQSF
jgi:hypothetical protein